MLIAKFNCIAITFTIISFNFSASNALAHGGRTNPEGCHNNRKTSSYHCHSKKTRRKSSLIQTTNSYNLLGISSEPSCSRKVRCYELLRCSDAKYYLNKCGFHNLDRDMDGIPCESICGN